ncbi:MAG TPA: class I SAM-dependent methyltransferase, partial [Candidatus Acidoferrales bacterium]|nr:class I SAM-dependent methyltransferase [Candidatus Acidoferrales bacterium]
YPPPVDDIKAYRANWDDARRRTEAALFWPSEPYRDDRSILVAGCGTTQAAHYAVRWPKAKVFGIDVSAASIAFSEDLKRKYGLHNLEVRQLPIERAVELDRTFEYVVSTGVLHHLPDPDAGLQALRAVLAPPGALNLMVYAPFGRAGVYMIQEYCRSLGIGTTDVDIDELATTLQALPVDHPLVPLLRNSPDFGDKAALADALLHPRDRAYSVPQFLDYVDRAGLTFGRWVRQAPYLPYCGALATKPHQAKLLALPVAEQYAAIELFRGTMVRHAAIAYANERIAKTNTPDFTGSAWLEYIPIRLPETVTVRERLPEGAAAVLINRNHTYNDLYLPIDAAQDRMVGAIDGKKTVAEIIGATDRKSARAFFEALWRWDQIVLRDK